MPSLSSTTFRQLKILSLSSLMLTFTPTPFIFVLETTSSTSRFNLAGFTMATLGISTFVAARPTPPPPPIQGHRDGGDNRHDDAYTGPAQTGDYGVQYGVPCPHEQVVHDRVFAEMFMLPDAQAQIPHEETIAETRMKGGDLLGR
ncbi:hypothetical protein BD310DRAFT_979304 [Dichomitus squalens]|uniref:Uncharacterized protein n=1 Tax=Dichomitus squalens TaxID=114155 RepID=A0A4Q9PNZ2_9APHY|nr:hypothetical protein BD310DRAFT_979304 [Dichomitus squalens]